MSTVSVKRTVWTSFLYAVPVPGSDSPPGLVVPSKPLAVVARREPMALAGSVIELPEQQMLVLVVRHQRLWRHRRNDDVVTASPPALVAAEEMRSILTTGPPSVRPKRCESAGGLSRDERRHRIERIVLDEEQAGAAKLVAARVGDHVGDGRERLAELRGELAAEHLDFLDRFQPVARVERPRGAPPLGEVAGAVHEHVVAPEDLPVRARGARIAGEAGGQRREVEEVAADERQRVDQPLADDLLNGCAILLEGRRAAR